MSKFLYDESHKTFIMRRIILIAVLASIAGLAKAQTQEGGWMVSSSSALSYSSQSNGGSSFSIFQLDLKSGVFIADNFLLGINLNHIGIDGSSLTTLGPLMRYYVNGAFFIGAGYDFQLAESSDGGLINFEGGYPIFVKDNIAIEPAFSYSIGTGDNDGLSVFATGIGFTLYF